MATIEVEHSEILSYPAATVFAALASLADRQAWQPDIVELRVDPPGPAQVGSQVHEARKIMGHKTEGTLRVSICEQNKRLVLETIGQAKQPTTERYQIEDLANGTCRLHYRAEIDGAAKVAQYFVRQAATKQIPDYVRQLTKLIASRT